MKLFYKDSYDDIGNQKGKVSWRVGDPRFSEGNSEPAGAGLGSSKKVVNKNSGWKAGVGTGQPEFPIITITVPNSIHKSRKKLKE